MNKIIFIIYFLLTGCTTIRYSESKMDSLKNDDFKIISQPFNVKFYAEILVNDKINKIEGTIKVNSKNDIFISSFSSVYGIEVFKMLLSDDSVLFIDKVNKKYFEGTISDFNNIKLDNIALLNLLFGKSCFKSSSFSISKAAQDDTVIGFFSSYIDTVSSIIGEIKYDNNRNIYHQFIKDSNGIITVEYSNFMKKLNLPQVLKIECYLLNNYYEIDMKYIDFKTVKDESFILKKPIQFSKLK